MVNRAVLLGIIINIMICADGYPGGFTNYNQDAAAVAMGDCFTSIADNGSAIFYNPAGINQIEGTQIRSGLQLYYPNTSFRGSESGNSTDMDDDISPLLMGYLTHKVNDKVSVGAGIFSPFGLATEWPDGWEGRTSSIYAAMTTICFNPAVSMQIHPRLSFAVGVDYVYADFKIRRGIDPNQLIGLPLGIPQGKVKLDGKDDTWGYNLGLLFHITDRWKLGVAYRSRLKLEFDGHAKYQLPTFLKPFFPSTDISPRMELPSLLSTEISARLWEKWTFAMGVLWTEWSVFDALTPKFRNDLLIPASMKSSPQNWRDVLTYNACVQYQLNPKWVIRGGYVFDQSPVPESTLGPMVPSADGHLLSFGIGYKKNGLVVDVGCMGMLPAERYTRRNVDGLNGKYTISWVSLVTSLTYSF